jgi:20S proteasome subunit beta 1
MAVTFDGGVIMGADSRTSMGAYIANRVADKITPIAPNVYVCRSGSAADTQAVSGYAEHFLRLHAAETGGPPRVRAAATVVRRLCYGNKDRLLAGMIVAGWDAADGASVYTVTVGGAMVRQPFSIGGSGSTYVYGYCDSNFKEGMGREECQRMVTNALSLAMARDGSSGGVIRLAIITKDGVERIFIPNNELPRHWEGVGGGGQGAPD